MNCREFESTLNDIARQALTDAGHRAAAEAHAAECDPCAALLSDARALTAGLRALSNEAACAAASPRVEANLLAAFRAHRSAGAAAIVEVAACEKPSTAAQATAASATTRSTPAVVPFASKRWSWSQTFGAAGLAAAAAVALVLLVPQMFSGPQTNSKTTSQADSRQPSKTNAAQPSQANIIAPPGVEVADVKQDDSVDKPPPPALVHTPRAHRGGATMTSVKYGGGARSNDARVNASPAANGDRAEITTDFIPLAQGGGFVAGEGGHVVRVELPRTALARFGLPFNAEDSGGRVKADVLLGEDGMARAIRFVR